MWSVNADEPAAGSTFPQRTVRNARVDCLKGPGMFLKGLVR